MMNRALLLALLFLSALPAHADVRFSPTRFTGVVRVATPTDLRVSTPQGLIRVPTEAQVSGARALGAAVTVDMPAFQGPVVGVEGDRITVLSQYGYPITAPAAWLSSTSLTHPVAVQMLDGEVVRVPLRDALELARTRGVDVLGDVPEGALVDGHPVREAAEALRP